MKQQNDHPVKKIDAQSLRKELSGISPLKMSQALLQYELYEQQSSLEILEQIYEEFEDSSNSTQQLGASIFFGIADGLVQHKSLGLKGTGLTASRLVNELKDFQYDTTHTAQTAHIDAVNNHNEVLKKRQQQTGYRRGEYDRKKMDNGAKANYTKERLGNKKTLFSDTERNNDGSRKKLWQRRDGKNTSSTMNTDHEIPLKVLFSEGKNNKFLTINDLKEVGNQPENMTMVSENYNKAKKDKTTSQYHHDNSDKHNDVTRANAKQREEQAMQHIEQSLNERIGKKVADDLSKMHKSTLVKDAHKQAKEATQNMAIGEIIILMIKPIYYEINDMFKNGVIADMPTMSSMDAFVMRMKRALAHITKSLPDTLENLSKDFLSNFATYLINGIANAFVGIFKKVLSIITQGFGAIIQAFIIMMDKKASPAQKADAVTKLLATTAIVILGSMYETVILGPIAEFLNGTPFAFLKDVIMIILTGITSSIVVYALDKIDLFNVKFEKRNARVREIFEMRIQAIKENTDLFETASLEMLAKQRIQFTDIITRFNTAIESNQSVHENVTQLASFMQIDLKVQTTNEFLELLKSKKQIVI